jgi:hypothetical protein
VPGTRRLQIEFQVAEHVVFWISST